MTTEGNPSISKSIPLDPGDDKRLTWHQAFWQKPSTGRILTSFQTGSYFPASRYKAAESLLMPGKIITPDLIRINDYRDDYERMFADSMKTGQSGFWVAVPFTGIPWMEAILGCRILAGRESFIAEKPVFMPYFDQAANPGLLAGNPWFQVFMDFTESLVKWSDGRFPVGQPILRGISDVLGALLGQSEMIFALYDEPEKISQMISGITALFLAVTQRQAERIPPFHGGCSIGFYDVWTPGRCIWYQDDLSAILSPQLFNFFILPSHQAICSSCAFSAMHLHPASFHHLDDILQLRDLKAIQINKDVGGPSIRDMMPIFHKIIWHGKRLIIWGQLDLGEVQFIREELSGSPVFLSLIADSPEAARCLQQAIDKPMAGCSSLLS